MPARRKPPQRAPARSRAPDRLIARSPQVGALRARRRASDRCLSAQRIGAPETLVVVDDALGARRRRRTGRARPARRERSSCRAACSRELATLPADVGVLAVVATPRAGVPPPADFCLLLEDVQDPGNVGSMIRTAAAAGVEQVLLSRHCAFAWSPKVLRAAQGAHFLTTLVEDVDLGAWIAAFRASGRARRRDRRRRRDAAACRGPARSPRDRDRQRRRRTVGRACSRSPISASRSRWPPAANR